MAENRTGGRTRKAVSATVLARNCFHGCCVHRSWIKSVSDWVSGRVRKPPCFAYVGRDVVGARRALPQRQSALTGEGVDGLERGEDALVDHAEKEHGLPLVDRGLVRPDLVVVVIGWSGQSSWNSDIRPKHTQPRPYLVEDEADEDGHEDAVEDLRREDVPLADLLLEGPAEEHLFVL